MKVRGVGSELLHADDRTDRLDEARSRFSQFRKRALKRWILMKEVFQKRDNHEIQRLPMASTK